MTKLRQQLFKQLSPLLISTVILIGCGGDSGIVAHKYEGTWNAIPDYETLSAIDKSTVGTIGTHGLGSEAYGLVLTGQLQFNESGNYRFHLRSDDGSRLWLNGELILENKTLHTVSTQISTPIALDSGRHEIRVDYFQHSGNQSLELRYQLNDGDIQHITEDMLFNLPKHHEAISEQPLPVMRSGATGARTDTLAETNSLTLGQWLVSRNGNFRLTFQTDGNLVLRNTATNQALWSSGTNGRGANRLTLQADGNLVMRSSSAAIWSTGTAGRRGARLVLQNDGVLALIQNGTVHWSANASSTTGSGSSNNDTSSGSTTNNDTTASSGQSNALESRAQMDIGAWLQSSNGTFRLIFQEDGNLVLRNMTTNRAMWATGTNRQNANRVVMQGDGNLVIRNQRGDSIWSSGTAGMSGSRLVLQNNGALVLMRNGQAHWAVNGSADTSGGGGSNTDTGGGSTGGGSTSGRIQLPIEVFGPAGTQESITFNVDDPRNITHLYLRCYDCGYRDHDLNRDANRVKAGVRVNGGARVSLKHYTGTGSVIGNRDIRIIGPEANYGGIGGGFKTVRMMVPVRGLVQGQNTITFEHINAGPPSMGFRIIEMNLLRSGSLSNRVLPASAFVDDDPRNWRAPHNTGPAITAGRDLWNARNRLIDPGVGRIRGTTNDRIAASCAGCHASDGRDLAYFNFSNKSIIERAKFHGLSQRDGENIASYIRNINIPVVRQARPWNPAYQPGPGLDSRPAYEWAAGAGVDAILDRDADMQPHLFPNGTTLTGVRRVVDRYSTLNLRELPLAIPMPDWNQWLPVIHPDDAFNTRAAVIRSDHQGRSVGEPYWDFLYRQARNDATPANLGNLSSRPARWLAQGLTCQGNGPGSGAPWRALNGNVLEAMALPRPNITQSNCRNNFSRAQLEPIELAKQGLAAWGSVKMWALVHSNNLEEQSRRMTAPVCSGGRCINASEPRGWVVDGRTVFDRVPHFLARNSRNHVWQSRAEGLLESNQWYHLNTMLNPGYRRSMPSHFAYVGSHVEFLQLESGVDQGFRLWATLIKQRQLQTNGQYGQEVGLDMRTAQPSVLYSDWRGQTNAQSSVGRQLWVNLIQATLEDFVADARNARPQDWANATRNSVVQPRNSRDFSFCDACFASPGGEWPFRTGALQGRNTFRVIPKFREIGVPEATLRSLTDWAEDTWPEGGWNRVRR